MSYLKPLKKARNKVYCHLDKKSLSIDDCNLEVLSQIENESINRILENIGYIIQTLYAIYSNICCAVEYSNQDDVYGMLSICEIYTEFLPNIEKLQDEKIEAKMEAIREV